MKLTNKLRNHLHIYFIIIIILYMQIESYALKVFIQTKAVG